MQVAQWGSGHVPVHGERWSVVRGVCDVHWGVCVQRCPWIASLLGPGSSLSPGSGSSLSPGPDCSGPCTPEETCRGCEDGWARQVLRGYQSCLQKVPSVQVDRTSDRNVCQVVSFPLLMGFSSCAQHHLAYKQCAISRALLERALSKFKSLLRARYRSEAAHFYQRALSIGVLLPARLLERKLVPSACTNVQCSYCRAAFKKGK